MSDDPLHAANLSPRCGAKTRSGKPCRAPAVTGRRRCRMHGGAPGSGGPLGKRNGNYRHGGYTKATKLAVRRLRAWAKLAREELDG